MSILEFKVTGLLGLSENETGVTIENYNVIALANGIQETVPGNRNIR